jgi:hypothetical protein
MYSRAGNRVGARYMVLGPGQGRFGFLSVFAGFLTRVQNYDTV